MKHPLFGFRVVLTIATIWPTYLTPALSAGEKTTSPPRYGLKVGQELSYHSVSSLSFLPGLGVSSRDRHTEWKVYVIRENRDGSWRLVLHRHESNEFWINDDQGKKQARPARVRSSVAFFDLFSDGRVVRDHPTQYGSWSPADLFPRLPPDAQAASEGWQEVLEHEKESNLVLFLIPRGENTAKSPWRFDEVGEDVFDPVVYNWRRRFSFDSSRGLVQRAETETIFDTTGKQKEVTELKGVKALDPAWLARLGEESDKFLAADKAYQTLTLRANTEKNVALLAEAESTVKKVQDELTVSFLREQVDDRLKNHPRLQKGYDDDEKRRKDVLANEAVLWETKDLTGKTHSLKDYRGKVVVLDFWYRRCLWCIKAMPQVVQIAQDFKDEPVVVLGMNIDDEDADAQFVVERLKIPLPPFSGWEGCPRNTKSPPGQP